MLSRSKIYFYLFLFVLLIQIPAPGLVKPLDELAVFLFLLVIAIDIIVNGNIKRYLSLFVIEVVFLFYLAFTVLFRDFNTPAAALNDFILQQKAFVPFLIAYAMTPKLEGWMRSTLKVVCIATSLTLITIFVSGMTYDLLGHVYHYGTISMSVSMIYLYCCMTDEGKVHSRDLVVVLLLLSVGLMGTRAKFYGEYVVALFMFFIYRPGLVRNMNFKHALVLIGGLALVILVAWNKIEYYFITGNADTFDPDVMISYARPVLYVTMFMIFLDYPIFGTGLASFATYSSSPHVNYSAVYHQYGIDKVYGLSPTMPDFIADAYFPELAQFGLVGVAIYIFFWVWIYQKLRLALHLGQTLEFTMGVIVISFALIESTSGATMLQSGAYIPMMVLGMIAGKYKNTSKEEKKQILSNAYIKN